MKLKTKFGELEINNLGSSITFNAVRCSIHFEYYNDYRAHWLFNVLGIDLSEFSHLDEFPLCQWVIYENGYEFLTHYDEKAPCKLAENGADYSKVLNQFICIIKDEKLDMHKKKVNYLDITISGDNALELSITF